MYPDTMSGDPIQMLYALKHRTTFLNLPVKKAERAAEIKERKLQLRSLSSFDSCIRETTFAKFKNNPILPFLQINAVNRLI
jgi:hypothetical protein